MRNPRALTLAEVATLVSRLSGQPCSQRQVRYLLVQNGIGIDAQPRCQGTTRLYSVLDVALVRLALALRAEGLSPWVIRNALTYRRDETVRAWKTAANLAFEVRGIEASLEPAARPRPARATAWVPLRPIWRGLDAEVQAISDGRDEVWMYRRVNVQSVPRPTSS